MRNTKRVNNLYNIKNLYLVLGVFLVLLLGIGYAILNTTLNINGVAEISKNTWDVHFENVVVQDGSVNTVNPATISDNGTEVSFTVPLSKPGDTYSFLVDIVNSGTIDALLNEIITTTLTTEQEKYLTFKVTHDDGKDIKSKDSLASGETKTILVIVQYNMDISNEDLVTTDETLTLSVKMNYIQDDGSGGKLLYSAVKNQSILDNISSTYVTSSSGVNFKTVSSDTNGKGVYTIASTASNAYPIYYYRGAVENNNVIFAGFCWKIVRTTDTGGIKIIYNGTPNDDGSCTATATNAQIGTSDFSSNWKSPSGVGYMYGNEYSYSTKNMNVAGFLNETTSSNGSISDTNYIYSDSVTYDEDTGLYTLVNGENRIWKDTYTNGGNQYKYTCLSETEDSCESVKYILDSYFSSLIEYITFSNGETATETNETEIVYGNDVTYDESTGMYTLVTTTTSKVKDWPTDFEKIVGANGYHYTCFTTSNTCSEVSYIYYHLSSIQAGDYGTSIYIKLTGGKKVEDALSEMFSEDNDVKNQTDSKIKSTIDTWYATNMTDYTNMLEDTIWCNDRSILSYGGWKKNSSGLSQYLKFSTNGRTFSTYTPTLNCSNKNDAFTMDDTENGNGKLTYPVGLLTSDEVMYAGGSGIFSNNTYYLYTGSKYWTLSPYHFGHLQYNGGLGILVSSTGVLSNDTVNRRNNGVRPVISLKSETRYIKGEGTSTKPYVVERIETE